MADKLYFSKRAYLVIFIFIASLSGIVLSVTNSTGIIHQAARDYSAVETTSHVGSQTDAKLDILKYLPVGANITNTDKDVIFADLDNDGQQEVIFFYTIRNGDELKANILALKRTGADYIRLWEDIYTGSQGFANPSGVYDLKKSGKPQIVAYRIIGASCPGILDIYQYANGTIERITGNWTNTCQSDLEIRDLNGDDILEVIFRRLKYGVNRDIYRWDGKQYVRSNSQFAQHYDSEVEKLVQSIYSHDPLPASARVTWCEQAVKIYILQKRYSEAKQLCQAVLQAIDDPHLTMPNSIVKGDEKPEQRDRMQASLEIDKAKGKATIYRLLGDTHKAAGDLKQAKKLYSTAQSLESEAKAKESVLLR